MTLKRLRIIVMQTGNEHRLWFVVPVSSTFGAMITYKISDQQMCYNYILYVLI